MKYTTKTNDPLILALVQKYKDAIKHAGDMRELVEATTTGTRQYDEAVDQLIEAGKDINQIEVTLCAAFVRGLEMTPQ